MAVNKKKKKNLVESITTIDISHAAMEMSLTYLLKEKLLQKNLAESITTCYRGNCSKKKRKKKRFTRCGNVAEGPGKLAN